MHVREEHDFFDADDAIGFGELISQASDPRSSGDPWSFEPEPIEVEIRRFRTDREVPTGYLATFSIIGPGARTPDGPTVCHVLFNRPHGTADLTESSTRSMLTDVGVDIPSGWELHVDDVCAGGFRTQANDMGTASPPEMARFVMGALRAIGAPLPTGRWRTTYQEFEH